MLPNPEILAREFWARTGLPEIFPRNIEQAVALTLPLTLVKLSPLNSQTIRQWLKQRGIPVPLPVEQRDLLGCLLAHRGHGITFVCEADEPEEQRLTVAHEVAHFLIDYLWPRQQVILALGEGVTEVLDGARRATPVERAAAVLSHLHLGAHVHILPRPGADENSDQVVACAEERADQLAFELVAPRECLLSFLQTRAAPESMDQHRICTALATRFGLPPYAFIPIVQKMGRRRPVSFLEDVMRTIRKSQ